jgi:hypothetical protein
MKEHLGGEATRLLVVNGKVKVSRFSGCDTASPAASDSWGALYAVSHVVNTSAGTELVCDRVEGVARETYRRSQGGVTNRLRQAVRNANKYLYLRNRVRRKGQVLLAALGCVAIRGMDAYGCGVGPHCILILSRGRVRAFVNPSPRREPIVDQNWQENGSLLGHKHTLSDPKFSYRQILPGECVLIMCGGDEGAFQQAASELAAILDERGMDGVARDLERRLGKHVELSALLVRMSPQGEWLSEGRGDYGTGVTTTVASPAQLSVSSPQSDNDDADAAVGSFVDMEGIRLREDHVSLGEVQPIGGFHASKPGADFDGGPAQALGRKQRQPQQLLGQGQETLGLAATAVISLLLGLWRGTLRLLRLCLDFVRRACTWTRQNRVLERLGNGCRLALIGLWAASKGLLIGILPERQGATVTYGASARPMARARVLGFHPSRRSRTLIGALIMLGVVVLVVTAAVRVRSRFEQAEVERLATQVWEQLVLADQQDDTEATLALLAEAQRLLEESQINESDSVELRQLVGEMDRQWDGLTGSIPMMFGEEHTLSTPDQVARRMVTRDDGLYVLDEGGQRLCRYALDEHGVLVADQEPWIWQVSAAEEGGHTTEIVDIEWIEAANGRLTPALLMLTAEGAVLELGSDGSVRPVAIADAAQWESPKALRTYSGNLYVLDVGRENIIKYIPSGDDYQHPPVEYVQASVDVRWPDVIDMAIDGFIYLLLSDGSIIKLAGGRAQPFPQDGLYPPLENPAGIFALPDASSVFVAEPSQGRIVEFNRDGQFIRQVRGARDGEDPFDDLRAFTVDVTHDRLLVAAGSGLFHNSLPLLD